MDPLPTIGKAYSMLLRFEKQREVHLGSSQDGGMNARFLNQERQGMSETGQSRRGQMDKKLQYCNHCKRNGHTRESCFKLTGYPKWYKNLMDQRKNAGGYTSKAYHVEVEGTSQRSVSVIESDLSDLVRLEIRRAMQEHTNTLEHDTNLVDLEDFAASNLPNKGNFDYRGTRYVFLGYARGCKSYKVYDLALKTTSITRDVVFHESEPSSFAEAQQKEEWKQAMQLEVQALEKNGTWDLVKAPTDKKPTGCRWIYKLKLKPNGSIERYKARLVAKGYNQVEGEDYTDCFAHVAKAVTMRIFLAVVVSKGWPIHHLDINKAFLHGSLKEDMYMNPAEGYQVKRGLGKLFGYKEVINCFLYIFRTCSHFLENEKASNGYLLQDLGISLPKPIPLFCDNKAAVHIMANLVFHECTKHLEIDCHIVRDKFKEGFVIPTHISAKE
ncbi:UNVERIFIED_CONTAM: Retrovirus-related Pol polyprotein from transposon RE1 [Sesamum radiatum]|uniref:Retrovirus-related Pol polyprotein from transposon RE1 n=1 Tax=Sesamum radiatum TaxID=300843 RepID=A0AAW2URC8_SESRA